MRCRNDLPSNMDAAVAVFERWCLVLLLDAMQRAGWFRVPGDSATAAWILANSPGGRARTIAELLQILDAAGFVTTVQDR